MKKEDILKLLKEFISIQTVSADSKRYGEILKAVNFLKKHLVNQGFKVEVLAEKKSPPLVAATKFVSKEAKTICIYGHYDVQSEDPVDEWKTPPFQLTFSQGKLYGRGVADSKGHVIQNIVSINRLIETNRLNNNIICIFEGEEEVASKHFEGYMKKLSTILSKADVFYAVDMGMFKKDMPQIMYGLRGLVYFELEVEIGKRDLHSGIYGNRVYNPAQVISHLFSLMKDAKTHKVLIPGFYDKVRSISKKERKLLLKVSKSDAEQKKEAGVYDVISLDLKQPYLSSKIYPSLDINGMVSGYIREGEKTVIPRRAMVKFSCRLVEFQNPIEVQEKVSKFIEKEMPHGVHYDLKVLSKSAAFYTDIDNSYTQKTAEILSQVFDNETLLNRSGGSVGVAEILQRLFKKPVILLGFILPDANIHSPNENFDEEMFWKGIEALKSLYSNI
ncbi:M20/M25/M40 family metallo-hydrolase [Candidatus Roizmanbacteria bacterium]|nr:M20/M25/M40 family metallo-hydrolase [Candidatus Roizmanbacteria bacterium]